MNNGLLGITTCYCTNTATVTTWPCIKWCNRLRLQFTGCQDMARLSAFLAIRVQGIRWWPVNSLHEAMLCQSGCRLFHLRFTRNNTPQLFLQNYMVTQLIVDRDECYRIANGYGRFGKKIVCYWNDTRAVKNKSACKKFNQENFYKRHNAKVFYCTLLKKKHSSCHWHLKAVAGPLFKLYRFMLEWQHEPSGLVKCCTYSIKLQYVTDTSILIMIHTPVIFICPLTRHRINDNLFILNNQYTQSTIFTATELRLCVRDPSLSTPGANHRIVKVCKNY